LPARSSKPVASGLSIPVGEFLLSGVSLQRFFVYLFSAKFFFGSFSVSFHIITGIGIANGNGQLSIRRFPGMKIFLTLLLAAVVTQSGCAFLGGAATGALATGAGYEIQAKRQMDQLDDDLRNERISRRVYEQRKEQIEKGSIIY
jgi:hypothetical protein